MDIIAQGPLEKYRDKNLTTYKDPGLDLAKVQATVRHLYMDDVSRNRARMSYGVAWPAILESGPDLNTIICRNCGKVEPRKSGCTMPSKYNDKRGNDHPGKV